MPAFLNTSNDGDKKEAKERKKREKKEAREKPADGESKKKGRPPMSEEEKQARKKMLKDAKEELKAEKKEEIKQRIEKEKEDKKKEREIKKEEKRLKLEYIKDWKRMRDDLDCDDHKDLPTPTPIQCRIPDELFSDFIMVLEFVNVFAELLELKDVYPQGITFDMLEHALVEKEVAVMEVDTEDISIQEAVRLANRASTWSQQYHGVPLQKAPLDALTLSEVLRLHILASGATSVANARWRHFNRGGFKNRDDPGLQFKLEEPAIIKALNTQAVSDLPLANKLKILSLLGLLTYASVRDVIDENIDKLKEMKNKLRIHQLTQIKKEKIENAAR
ncbi:Bromodomain adjacent to zinc finger domain protein 1A [Penaeus vannamei]|uniref:Bromodomain adjacent to zinc finger domain protein 1A n=1 Tax=Penaeus vannamei TaxID=6689 RepID=A0A423U8L1_PENVA|nr:Bromodomain adjacent to zinc finger domain protein 1A [Penaeus vannamei]